MKNPGKIDDLNRYYDQPGKIAALDVEIQPLATNNDVRRVIIGDKIGVRLDYDALGSLARLNE